MEFYRFDKEVGKNISHFNSNFIMSRIVKTEKPTQIGCMHLEANGIVGFHQAVIPQLLIVVDGEGWVRGDDELKVNIKANDVIFWEKGEGHETATATGLTAIVIESEELTPSNFMPIKEYK
ncbi:cupin [Peribacillus sp. AS_2]|uniref:cupin n=1 Tax=Peribacillus sp. AS_2 TaxID=2996755 RepID=UPI0022A6A566|nr:cupin [Peribacillus sp. AS_2]MCZ0874960.1 cupin [Peribacillus sp. AS_2]